MDFIVNLLQYVPAETWTALGASLGISVVVQMLKHWIDGLGQKTLVTLVGIFAFIASVAEYLLSVAAQNPAILGAETATLVGLSTLVYRFLVAPVYNLLLDAKAYRETSTTPTPEQIEAANLPSELAVSTTPFEETAAAIPSTPKKPVEVGNEVAF